MSKNIINVIPGYASVEESALYVIESMEDNFNTMMQTIGVTELQHFEESGEILNEAEQKEGFIQKIIEWIKETWAKVRGLYEKALAEIKKQIDKIKAKIASDANKEKCKKMAERLKDDKKYGKGREWTGFDKVVSCEGDIWDGLKQFDHAITQVKIEYSMDPKNIMNIRDQLDEARAKMISKVDAANKKLSKNATNRDIQVAVKEVIEGKEVDIDKKYILSNFDVLWNYATDFGKTASELKKSLNKTKAKFEESEKYFKNLLKNKDDNTAVIKEVIKYTKESKATLIAINGAILTAAKSRSYESARIMLRLAVAVKTKEEKEAKQEKVEESAIEPTSFQTELASLFNF